MSLIIIKFTDTLTNFNEINHSLMYHTAFIYNVYSL